MTTREHYKTGFLTGLTMVDGVEMNATNPDTFDIPSALKKSHVAVGDMVKVGVICDDVFETERFWVSIYHVGVEVHDKVNYYFATVANDLVMNDEIDFGSQLVFTADHILAIYEQ